MQSKTPLQEKVEIPEDKDARVGEMQVAWMLRNNPQKQDAMLATMR